MFPFIFDKKIYFSQKKNIVKIILLLCLIGNKLKFLPIQFGFFSKDFLVDDPV